MASFISRLAVWMYRHVTFVGAAMSLIACLVLLDALKIVQVGWLANGGRVVTYKGMDVTGDSGNRDVVDYGAYGIGDVITAGIWERTDDMVTANTLMTISYLLILSVASRRLRLRGELLEIFNSVGRRAESAPYVRQQALMFLLVFALYVSVWVWSTGEAMIGDYRGMFWSRTPYWAPYAIQCIEGGVHLFSMFVTVLIFPAGHALYRVAMYRSTPQQRRSAMPYVIAAAPIALLGAWTFRSVFVPEVMSESLEQRIPVFEGGHLDMFGQSVAMFLFAAPALLLAAYAYKVYLDRGYAEFTPLKWLKLAESQ